MLAPEDKTKNLLLISSSNVHGQGYLDHVENEIRHLLASIQRVVFVPYALYDRDAYATKAGERFGRMGFTLESVHPAANARRLLEEAQAVFIGGGNTFRLLKALYDHDLLGLIRERV